MEIKYLYDIDKFHLYKVDEIFSTNTYLKDNYDKFENLSILWAIKQTNGRGRLNRVWESNDDLTFSIVFKEENYNQIMIPLMIIEALKKYDINASIKWPNDIYYNDKKLCGILIENIYDNNVFKASIVGIGINYNDYSKYNGIGLNKSIDKEDLIKNIIFQYNNFKDNKNIIDIYKNNNMVIGKNIKYKNKIYKAIDVDLNGYLILCNDDEKITVFSDEIDIKKSIL